MTAVWLLPIVTCVVGSSSGAVVAGVLSNAQHALWTILASYILWGIGVPFAMMVIVIYLHRLTLHKLPAKRVIVSVFLPLGPLGQGSFGYVFTLIPVGCVCILMSQNHETRLSSSRCFPQNSLSSIFVARYLLYCRVPNRADPLVLWLGLAVFRRCLDFEDQNLSF